MPSPDASFRRRLLIDSLTMLAADAQTQADWLDKHGVATDEITLDFDHAFRMAEALVEEGRLSGEVMADLREIDVVLSGMYEGDDADLWARGVLSTDNGWAQARELARRVLVAELGEWQQPLPVITVVR
ncbi:hypothetical protein AB0I66_35640 [Streptomyces sp. NPDC050439]|uniref:hypothetical protein n=1 Tax=unclassified Streptomyces TaxID=2593676 RepID=UPI0034197D50